MPDINPGDHIEIAFTTHDGTIWNPALVVRVQHDRIVVNQAGERKAIPNNPRRYRLAKKAPKAVAEHPAAAENAKKIEELENELREAQR